MIHERARCTRPNAPASRFRRESTDETHCQCVAGGRKRRSSAFGMRALARRESSGLGHARRFEVARGAHGRQAAKVLKVLGAEVVVTGEDLHRDEVTPSGDGAFTTSSAPASSATATARSTSRVIRGSPRTPTARPPTSANLRVASAATARRKAASRSVTGEFSATAREHRRRRRARRRAAWRATATVPRRRRPARGVAVRALSSAASGPRRPGASRPPFGSAQRR